MERTLDGDWKEIITPHSNIFRINLKEIWENKDLLFILVNRDITAIYKQTVLGPLWFFLQPMLTTMVYVIAFSRVGKLSTGGIPPTLFYLTGLVIWMFFSDCVTRTASFVKDNSQIFSKVNFPKLVIPYSIILTNLVKFSIQFLLFLCIYFFYSAGSHDFKPSIFILLFPIILIQVAVLGLAAGMIVSALTTKYKDLSHLIQFGIQLLMFISTVIFPLSSFEGSRFYILAKANPMTGFIECFRLGFFGKGHFSWEMFIFDLVATAGLFYLGNILFNMVEKNLVDTI